MKLFAGKAVLAPACGAGGDTFLRHAAGQTRRGIFDMLFGGAGSSSAPNRSGHQRRKAARSISVRAASAAQLESSVGPRTARAMCVRAAPAKISAPSYYTYRADALRAWTSRRWPPSASRHRSTAASAGRFREAVSGLGRLRAFGRDRGWQGDHRLLRRQSRLHLGRAATTSTSRGREAVRVLGEAAATACRPPTTACPCRRAASRSPATRARNAGIRSASRWRCRRACCAMSATPPNGRVDPNRISGYYDLPAKPLDLVAVLKTSGHSADVRA